MYFTEEHKIMEFKAVCDGAERVAIAVHSHPDGDAMGCSCGLAFFLSSCMGADCRIIIPDPYPQTLSFFVPDSVVIDASESGDVARNWLSACDLLVVMDMNVFDRAGDMAADLAAVKAPKVLIDHHLNPCAEAFDLVFSETEISSASELTYWILKSISGGSVPVPVLRSLTVGMTTDTNNFANSVWPSTFTMAAEVLAAGVDREEILSYLYNEYRENRLRAMGFVLSEKMTLTDDGVAYVVLSREEQEMFDLRDGETEGFVNMPLAIGKVSMTLLLKEDSAGYYRVSVRSKKGISANAFAKEYFHGGGHENASGGRLYFPGDIAEKTDVENYVRTVSARFMKKGK